MLTHTCPVQPVKTPITYFDPGDYLINIVRRAAANRQNISISTPGAGEIEVFGACGEYLPLTAHIEMFCTLPANDLAVHVHKHDHPIGRNARPRSIMELLWHAGFYASRGRLMDGCGPDDVVQLLYWPNLSRLPITPNSIRIAALLTRYPTSLSVARRLLHVEWNELFQFYTAARCAGLAYPVNHTATEPTLEPHHNKSLLEQLLRKIASL